MTSKERVEAVIRHEKPDRMPIYGWVRYNMKDKIDERFGSVEAFEDHYAFDLAHLFGGPDAYFIGDEYTRKKEAGEEIEPPDVLNLPLNNPEEDKDFDNLRAEIKHHKEVRSRFVYVQTPGLFEQLNTVFGIENHLCYLLEYPDEIKEIYRRQAEWNRKFAGKCLDLGVDMIHVSDDWGSQKSLLFSPDIWWDMIYPGQKLVADYVKGRGGHISLHSDGDINLVVDGIKKIGYDVVHPWQESAGMSYEDFLKNHSDSFSIMSGYDIQTTLGFGRLDDVRSAAERVVRLFGNGGLIFCTTHFVQDHCSIDELVFAYDTICELTRT